MRKCGYITRRGNFIDLDKLYPDMEHYMSKHDQYCYDNDLEEEDLMNKGWVKLTTVCDPYIYMLFRPLAKEQVNTLIDLGYKIEEGDM